MTQPQASFPNKRLAIKCEMGETSNNTYSHGVTSWPPPRTEGAGNQKIWGEQRTMDITKMLTELRQESQQIEEAILSLERLARGRGKRRGRPPAWMSQQPKRRGRPPGSKNKPKTESKSSSKAAAA